jgi:hypothetical protein
VLGLTSNARFLQTNIRDGILLHTGNWTTASQPWDETMTMPNSAGCVHGHPTDIKKVRLTWVVGYIDDMSLYDAITGC